MNTTTDEADLQAILFSTGVEAHLIFEGEASACPHCHEALRVAA
ncbi:MAG: hypothetical protein ACRDWH_01395 [Acidimicrobiia bacterium]